MLLIVVIHSLYTQKKIAWKLLQINMTQYWSVKCFSIKFVKFIWRLVTILIKPINGRSIHTCTVVILFYLNKIKINSKCYLIIFPFDVIECLGNYVFTGVMMTSAKSIHKVNCVSQETDIKREGAASDIDWELACWWYLNKIFTMKMLGTHNFLMGTTTAKRGIGNIS